jgi:hypothetical protein
LYSVASSSLFGFTPISNQLAKGNFIVGNDAGVAQATTSIFISSTGQVGIGTTTPTELLSIQGGANTRIKLTSSSGYLYSTILENNYSAANPFNIKWAGANILTVENSAYQVYLDATGNTAGTGTGLRVAGSLKLFANLAGNVGIGTASTTQYARLDVAGANNGTLPLFQLSSVVAGATTTQFIVTNSGNLGIGTTSPFAKLSVAGNGYFDGNLTASNLTATGTATIGSLTGVISGNNGALYATATSSVTSGSGISISGTGYTLGSGITITNNGVLSLSQTYSPAAVTGAITLGTTTGTFNGLNLGVNIDNSSGFFTFMPTMSGTLTIAGGGTGLSSITGNRMLYTNANGTALLEVATSTLSIGGNAGTVTNGVYTTTFNNLFDNRLSASSSI